MRQIVDGRGRGKTKQLMLFAKENNVAFVCRNPAAMREKAHSYGITGINFVGYKDCLANKDGELTSDCDFVIDELELFVKYMVDTQKAKMVGYTLSVEE